MKPRADTLPRIPGSPVVGRLLGPAGDDANVLRGHGTMWDNPELATIAADFLELPHAVPGAPIKAMEPKGKPAASVPAHSGEWVVLRSPDAMGNGEAGR